MTNLLGRLTPFAIVFFAALALTLVLTPIVREVNRRLGMVDKPDPRRINKVPIPRGGGVALFLGLFGSFIVYVFATGSRWVGSGVGTHPVRVTALAGILFLIGLADDKWSLPPKLKLLGHGGTFLRCRTFLRTQYSGTTKDSPSWFRASALWLCPP